jgi:hypothetical protein
LPKTLILPILFWILSKVFIIYLTTLFSNPAHVYSVAGCDGMEYRCGRCHGILTFCREGRTKTTKIHTQNSQCFARIQRGTSHHKSKALRVKSTCSVQRCMN